MALKFTIQYLQNVEHPLCKSSSLIKDASTKDFPLTFNKYHKFVWICESRCDIIFHTPHSGIEFFILFL